MDTAHWPQGIVVKPIEEIVTNTCPKPGGGGALIGGGGPNGNLTGERKARPQKEQALNCPRCNSTNTKFCYYNNYSLTQPRYFCKTCRRYWTEGGSLRNIPVGGGSRKNKRSSSSSSSVSASSAAAATVGGNNNSTSTTSNNNSSSSSASKRLPDLIQTQGQDLNLTFPSSSTSHQDFRNIISDHLIHHHHNTINDQNKQNNHIISDDNSNPTTTTTTSHLSALELLTGLTSRGLNSFMPMPPGTDPTTTTTTANNNNNLGFPIPMQDFKPTLNFSLDGLGVGSGYGGLQVQGHVQESGGRLLFPFEDLKQNGGGIDHHHHHHHQNKDHGDSTGYWTGMLGGGSW